MALRDDHARPYAVDQRTGTVGVIMGESFGEVYLRPVHGGPEWTPPPESLRPATPEEIEAALG